MADLNSSAIEVAFSLGMAFGEIQAHVHELQKDVHKAQEILAEGRQQMLADREKFIEMNGCTPEEYFQKYCVMGKGEQTNR